jgi:hypothetical protein
MGIVFGDCVSNFMRVEYPFDFRLSNPEFTLSVYPENIATVMYVATAIEKSRRPTFDQTIDKATWLRNWK